MIEPLLWTAAALCMLIAAHPFVTYPLSLKAMRPRRATAARAASTPRHTFSLCMCAYNEESVIEAKARNLLALKAKEPDLQVLIYVDAASDRTAELLQPYAKDFEIHVAKERRGKTHGMNLLVARATGSLLVFTDANVMIDPGCLDALREDFAAPEVGCVCGNMVHTNSADSVTASTGSLYWRLEEHVKLLEQRTGSVMGAHGALFALRRSLHSPPPDHIIDDMYVSFMVLIQGYRIVQSTAARAYEATASRTSEEFRRKSRIACQAFNVHRLLWPRISRLDRLTVYKYFSHKFLRWVSIYFLASASLFALAALIVAGNLAIAVGLAALAIALIAIGLFTTIKPLSQIADVLTSLAGAGLGVWQSLRGQSYQTWTPVASVRRSAE
jgi:cellulose synthase/poly-beta-1,6-N-acetylglucosamine synthase-like glycosyltransferase